MGELEQESCQKSSLYGFNWLFKAISGQMSRKNCDVTTLTQCLDDIIMLTQKGAPWYRHDFAIVARSKLRRRIRELRRSA